MALLARAAAALAGEDAQRALDEVLAVLKQAGLVVAGEDRPACIEATTGGRRLALAALGEPPQNPLRDALRQLLHVALARAADQRELERVRERLDMFSEASFEGLMVHVEGEVILDANRRLLDLLRCQRADLEPPGTAWFVAPEDLPRARQRVRERAEGPFVFTAIRKDGSRFRAELQSKQGKLGERPVRVVAIRDVTERERAMTLLCESENRLRELAEKAFDVIAFSRDGVILEVTGASESVLGFRPEELVGRRILDFVAPQFRETVCEALARKQSGQYESEALSKSGAYVPLSIVAIETTLAGKPVRMTGIQDLREARRLEGERRRLEEQKQHSQRLESLGVLAGGIAHDFNNLLVGVLGNAGLLLEAQEAPEHRELCSAIISAAQGAAGLTAQLLAYAGRQELGPRQVIDLGSLWRELAAQLGPRLSPRARLDLRLSRSGVVLGDRAALTQVFMNLLTNASDALDGGGDVITVLTERVSHPDARWQAALGARVGPGDWVLVEVHDMGVGMDAATLQRIFEPFFSTKPGGHGLGLASCLGIVSAHGGAVHVDSAPGRGTRFAVLLPAASRAGPAPSAPPLSTGGSRRIVVIDDEPLVRSFLRRALTRQGYAVIEAASGEAGLRAIAESTPDLVLLDLCMPFPDGAEVLRRLRASGCGTPVVIASGNLDLAIERRLAPGSFQAFLQKPFSADELLGTIERCLESGSSPRPPQR